MAKYTEINLLQLAWIVINGKRPRIKYISKLKHYTSYDSYDTNIYSFVNAFQHDSKIYIDTEDAAKLPKEFKDLDKIM